MKNKQVCNSNKIVHDYDGVNLQLVWEIISNDIPELKKMLSSI